MPNKQEKVIDLNPTTLLKTQIKNWALVASVILMVFYSAWIPIQTQLFKQGGEFNYSDLNPFTFKKDNLSTIEKVKFTNSKKEIKAIQPIEKISEKLGYDITFNKEFKIKGSKIQMWNDKIKRTLKFYSTNIFNYPGCMRN